MGLYVVGMHRSGTSALAGLLSSLLQLPAGRLAVDSNPTGQWERPELRPALELVLAWNNTTWASPPPETATLACPAPLASYATRVFERHCVDPFLWKDPRLCLTIDRWLALPQPEPRIVVLHRRPDEVADSLQRRNGWPTERGLALWERTTRNAVVRLGGREVFVVDHAELLAEPDQTAADLGRWLGQNDPDASARAATTVQPRDRAPEETGSAQPAGSVQLTDAQTALAARLARHRGPTRLDLDGIGPESPATAELLGSPGPVELARRTARAIRAIPRRHNLEIAGPAA